MTGLVSKVRSTWEDESGGVTVLAVFSLLLTVVCLGFAIDATNLYRHQAMLRFTADAAAHAGASALARGATPKAAEAAAMDILTLNLPNEPEGSLLADPATDLRALVVDPDDGTLSKADPDSPANAMLVSLQRSETAQNPIPTFILRLFGVEAWSTGASSVATVATTRRCANAAGFFAHGTITIGSQGVGKLPEEGFCLHSQQSLSLPTMGDRDAAGPRVSLPQRGGCNGGACDRAAEVNLIMPDLADYVTEVATSFASSRVATRQKSAFFSGRPISKDLEPLLEVGTKVRDLQTGDVVVLSPFRFRLLREVPQGLVYVVHCGQPGAEMEAGGKEEIVIGDWPEAPVLRNIALITSCPIRLEGYARIEGALIVSTAKDAGLLSAATEARIGDPTGNCDATKRSVLMTPGDLTLPWQLSTSNIAVVAGGNISLGIAGAGSRSEARGIAVHAGGEIWSDGTQSIKPCPDAADSLLPALRVISHTMPPVEGWVTPVTSPAEADLPGNRPNSFELLGARS